MNYVLVRDEHLTNIRVCHIKQFSKSILPYKATNSTEIQLFTLLLY